MEQHRHFVPLAQDGFWWGGGPAVPVAILISDGGVVAAHLHPVINTPFVLPSLLNVDIVKLQQDMFSTTCLECCLLISTELVEPRKTVTEIDLIELRVVISCSVITGRSVLHLVLSLGKLYSALRSATERVVSLHRRWPRLQTGKVEYSCRSSVVAGLHQGEDPKVPVVVVEPLQWKHGLGGGRCSLAPAEESGEQDSEGAGSHPDSD